MSRWSWVAESDVLLVEGADRVDLLHRLSSNDLAPLAANFAVRETLLTTHQGRLIDWLWLVSTPDGLLALAGPGRAARLTAWLDGYTIMEDVRSSDATSRFAHVRLYGTGAAAATGLAELAPPGAAASAHGALWFARPSAFGPWVDGVVPRARLDETLRRLAEAGFDQAPRDEAERARIDAGVPGPTTEYSDDVNPLELRLGPHAVSFSKGCYIGQEVIARLDSYDKVARVLVGFTVSAGDASSLGPVDLAAVAAAAKLTLETQSAGRVTSLARRPDGSLTGLAVIKRELAQDGAPLLLQWDGRAVGARLEDRVFWTGQAS